MHVQTHPDRNVQASEALVVHVEAAVISALGRFAEQVTRVDVHLSDENGAKGGADDKRCVMEARLEGRPPTAVTHQAATVEEAMNGAAGKLARWIEGTLARRREY